MEPPQGRGRITPLPPPESDGTGRPRERVPQPWVVAVLGIAGLLTFAVWLTGQGTSIDAEGEPAPAAPGRATLAPLAEPDPPNAPDQTVPSTLAPRLGELLPRLDGSLLLLARGFDGEHLLVWDQTATEPQRHRLSGDNITNIQPEPATLNYLAYQTAGRVRSLYFGGWQTQEPIFVGSRGFAWDPAGTATLMWVGEDQVTMTTSLYRQQIGEPIERIIDLPSGSELEGWTIHGLIVSHPLGPSVNLIDPAGGRLTVKTPTITTLLDDDGDALASVAAQPLRVSPLGTVVARGTGDAITEAGLSIDSATLVPPHEVAILDVTAAPTAAFSVRSISLPEALSDGESIFAADGRWSLHPAGEAVGRVVKRRVTSSLVVHRLDTQGVTVVSLPEGRGMTTVGFSSDGKWFFAWAPDTGDLVAVASSGGQYVVPLADNIRLDGVYIRP